MIIDIEKRGGEVPGFGLTPSGPGESSWPDSGTKFDERSAGAPEAAAADPALILIQGSAADKFQVTPGFVNALMPTLGGTAINNATPPEITITADRWVYVKVVGLFGSPDTYTITIEQETTAAVPADAISATGFTSYFLIGLIDFTSGSPDTFAITNDHSGGNLGVENLGAVNFWWNK